MNEEEKERAKMAYFGRIFEQLYMFPEFQEFIRTYFNIHKLVDETTNTLDVKVTLKTPVEIKQAMVELIKEKSSQLPKVMAATLEDLKQVEKK